ncbi:uncharacterized LOC100272754 [Zea mays]|uniref:Cytochrome b5 heme-binding domain-containing protein n=1 Tax=Zea mays TaxID=4577 RepID=B4FQG9_MAIZE|nr:uncharacterized LOC100272754 [Zea mays]ACF84362.1 unknown [Zea mays]|eukprot:NP_001140679.1 uncharacterized protein LOC100272754 [Zea mays]
MAGEAKKLFFASEVTLHASRKDCWVVIGGKVYDVTKFLEDHPGGEDVLLHASAAPCPVQARAHPCCAICRARPCALAEAAAAPTTTLGEIALGEVVLGDVMLDRAPRLHHSPWTHRPWKSCIVVLVFHEHYVSNKSCLHPTSCKY